jgi:hypothetical protein
MPPLRAWSLISPQAQPCLHTDINSKQLSNYFDTLLGWAQHSSPQLRIKLWTSDCSCSSDLLRICSLNALRVWRSRPCFLSSPSLPNWPQEGTTFIAAPTSSLHAAQSHGLLQFSNRSLEIIWNFILEILFLITLFYYCCTIKVSYSILWRLGNLAAEKSYRWIEFSCIMFIKRSVVLQINIFHTSTVSLPSFHCIYLLISLLCCSLFYKI